jgi:hypothetical protein
MQMRDMPAMAAWAQATANMTPDQWQRFTLYCWTQNMTPNMPALRQWRANDPD